jgi:hypothetical protein
MSRLHEGEPAECPLARQTALGSHGEKARVRAKGRYMWIQYFHCVKLGGQETECPQKDKKGLFLYYIENRLVNWRPKYQK